MNVKESKDISFSGIQRGNKRQGSSLNKESQKNMDRKEAERICEQGSKNDRGVAKRIYGIVLRTRPPDLKDPNGGSVGVEKTKMKAIGGYRKTEKEEFSCLLFRRDWSGVA